MVLFCLYMLQAIFYIRLELETDIPRGKELLYHYKKNNIEIAQDKITL